jgi:hypothetical protein
LVPSAEQAANSQLKAGAGLVAFHEFPELVEKESQPFCDAATSRPPKAEEAMAVQLLLGALVGDQVTPESAEV